MRSKLKILILDDERGGIQHLHDALSAEHCMVWVRTIIEAHQLLEDGHFDIIICGTHLQQESMFQFLKEVREKAVSKNVPFICFRSGSSDFAKSSDSQIEYTSQLLGANAYIVATNTTDPNGLRSQVEAVLKLIRKKNK